MPSLNTRPIRALLIANRSEIAIRVMRAANEMGIRTVSIYSQEDRFALHRFKADESYLVGEGKKPIQAYLDIDDILRIARQAKVDAIHPGYGFLSENPEFAQAVIDAGMVWIGPSPAVMRTFGNKVAARKAAQQAQVAVMPATEPLPRELDACQALAQGIGYPVMLKASWGGGGRGMRVIESQDDLVAQMDVARREALAAFGNDEIYLEKLVRKARHVEVQLLGDRHGNLVHLFERDCSVQRRHQKVVERAPAPYLSATQRESLCASAVRLGKQVGYTHAGTVEFLLDADSNEFYFIEVNPRIQVEHTVTEEVTGVDLIKAQILVSEGARIGHASEHGMALVPSSALRSSSQQEYLESVATAIPAQEDIRLNGHALQCRITTEDPENGFTPDYGRITAYRSAAGMGIRLDGGTAYTGAVITPYYDSLLVKVTAWAPSNREAIRRMDRALREFRIRGVTSNLQFVENVINHADFSQGNITTRFIDNTPALFQFSKRRDRATKLLRFLGEVIVNGNPEVKGRDLPVLPLAKPVMPSHREYASSQFEVRGLRSRLQTEGPKAVSQWMRGHGKVLLTDTTMRDAHQSLFATRMRTADMLPIADYYRERLDGLFSVECWGGATFDVALRFLKEDPWLRLSQLRERMPNHLLQMLLRSANAVGYTNYPDNVVRQFVQRAAANGIDVFRVFDSLNWVKNMRVAMDTINESGALCEAAICYTGDLFDPTRSKYNLAYYVNMAKELEKAGAHIIGIKDMAGVCRPRAASALVKAIRDEVGLPVHFHTHDTSGAAAASVLAAVEAGCDAVDAALDSMSGLTSQPSMGAIVAALEGTARAPDVTSDALNEAAHYWEGVRRYYSPFEADIRSGTSDVYRHEMPGGQYTNLREQARAMGLDHRWGEVSKAYASVNQMFGDIVKVTPTSKVVGDMALFMVANDLTADDVLDPWREVAFPESVVSLFKGELGFPADGFPAMLSRKVLRAEPPAPYRPGERLAETDLSAALGQAEKEVGHKLDSDQLASYLMYPKVYREFAEHQRKFGDVSVIPTPTFFYGLQAREEVAIDIDSGKTLLVRLQGVAPSEEEDEVKVFFELNGQPRTVRVEKAVTKHAGKTGGKVQRPRAEDGNVKHMPSPMPGMVVTVAVKPGQQVKAGDPLVSIEAMKMETQLRADKDGVVKLVHVKSGDTVAAKDLLVEFN